MDIGLAIPQRGPLATLDALRHLAVAAEQGGFASLWAFERIPAVTGGSDGGVAGRVPDVFDQLLDRAVDQAVDQAVEQAVEQALDPVVAASTAAAVTERIRIGVDALVAASYPVQLLHRLVHSLDRIGACRLVFGLDRVDSSATVGPPLRACAHGPARDGLRVDLGVDPARLRLVERGAVTVTAAPLGHDRPRFVGSLEQVRADVARLCNDGARELVLDLHRAATSVDHLLDLALDLTATLQCPA